MSKYKNDDELFENLINLTADEWNSLVAERLDTDIETVNDLILLCELDFAEQLVHLRINKSDIRKYGKLQLDAIASSKVVDIHNNVFDTFTILLDDDDRAIQSIALTGKIIIGVDFTNSRLSESYFAHCIFYNCKFDSSMLGDCTIANCKFIKCSIVGVDFTGSTIAKTKFLRCDLNKSVLEYVNISDCAVLQCNFSLVKISQSRVLYTGFSDVVFNQIDWKDSSIVQCSFISTSLIGADFRRSSFIDDIFIRTDFTNCDFEMLSVTCMTNAMCTYNKIYAPIFEMSHVIYSPAVYEWESDDGVDEIE